MVALLISRLKGLEGFRSSAMVNSKNGKGRLRFDGDAAQKKGRLFCCGGAQLEQKGCVVDLNHKAAEELAEIAVWSEKWLGHAREHGQRKLVWLLEAVRVEIDLENALLALPLGEHLASARGSA